MAKRPFFKTINSESKFFVEEECEFTYHTGFALSQKQKSVNSLHEQILKKYPDAKVLEVSRKSPNPLGPKLSAFNLIMEHDNKTFPIENVFQASKVFENGGPYRDLLKVHPRDAKRDERLRTSGKLIKFSLNNEDWDLEPKTMFYDWIYINALYQNKELTEEIVKYDTFTDIEFNPNKSFNCQARSVAIFVSLYNKNLLEKYLSDKEVFQTVYNKKCILQGNLFS